MKRREERRCLHFRAANDNHAHSPARKKRSGENEKENRDFGEDAGSFATRIWPERGNGAGRRRGGGERGDGVGTDARQAGRRSADGAGAGGFGTFGAGARRSRGQDAAHRGDVREPTDGGPEETAAGDGELSRADAGGDTADSHGEWRRAGDGAGTRGGCERREFREGGLRWLAQTSFTFPYASSRSGSARKGFRRWS